MTVSHGSIMVLIIELLLHFFNSEIAVYYTAEVYDQYVSHQRVWRDMQVVWRYCREDWKPVLTINSIVYGLQYLFLVSILSFCY